MVTASAIVFLFLVIELMVESNFWGEYVDGLFSYCYKSLEAEAFKAADDNAILAASD